MSDIEQRVIEAFERQFGPPAPRLFRAPGRVNLIGEHTDYNQGFVLPAAIDRQAVVAARPRADTRVEVYSLDFQQTDAFDLGASERQPGHWSNYVRGIAWSLQAAGHPLVGADLALASDVPIGAGLSSSAAVEVAAGYAFLRLANVPVDGAALALAAQRAENDFVGVNSGIMDQFISCLGQEDHALLIDCRSLAYRALPLPAEAAIVVAHSGIRRGLLDSGYNTRRQECEEAARMLGVSALREVDEGTLNARAGELPPVLARRARHVVSENARTLAAAEALEAGDLRRFGQLMNASHASLRDDYEVSLPALDLLVRIAQGVDGVYGARLTGAGFGGSIIALAHRDAAGAVVSAIETEYPPASGHEPTVYICRAADGASELTVAA